MSAKSTVFDLYDPLTPQLVGTEYFYDGELPVTNGHIYVPKTQTDWVQRLLCNGYQFRSQNDADEYLAVVD